MIEVTDKSRCCGCSACAGVCPVQCITMAYDTEGFVYPDADAQRCISCGRCEDVCPMKTSVQHFVKKAYAVRVHKYESESSSGGVFSALAEKVISGGGVIYGAAFDKELTLRHIRIADMADLGLLRGSKYVQSYTEGIYQQVQKDLSYGRKVLFSGTPCQVAGLRKFLNEDYSELLTVDLACHGVPSPKVWSRHINEKGKGLFGVNFRDKSSGWRKYNIAYSYRDRVERVRFDKDPYMQLFLQNVSIRPSCYDCAFRNGGNQSDMTLGDYWAISQTKSDLNDGRGVSVVISNTRKGELLINELKATDCIVQPVEYKEAVKVNGGFSASFAVPTGRDEFFKGLDAADDLHKYISGFVRTKSFVRVAYERIHTILAKIKRRIMS